AQLLKLVCDSSEQWREERGRAGGRQPAGHTEITLKLERVWNRKCWGGCALQARVGCGKWRLRSERPPAALLFVRSRAASFRALQWVRGGLSGLSSDKAEWGSGSAGRYVDCLRGGVKDLKEKKEVVEEAENGRDAPANGNANEENGEQEADNEVDEEEEEGGEEEEEEEEGDGEEEDGDEDEEAEAATGKRAAEDDEDDDVDTKKQKTDEDD
uniref:Prothymosin alpha n=1 Tax=Felis catus TaxID=9685 RepID=A0ABI7ZHI4_FELCA